MLKAFKWARIKIITLLRTLEANLAAVKCYVLVASVRLQQICR